MLNLQLLSLVRARERRLDCEGGPAQFVAVGKFTAVEALESVPNGVVRMLLRERYLAQKYMLAGGYVAKKCGLTTTYDDIDVFTIVKAGEGEKKANQIAETLYETYDVDVEGVYHIYRSAGSNAKEKYVVKVPLLQMGHPLYNCYDGAACDIVIVESDSEVGNVWGLARDIVGDFDYEICKCIGVNVCEINRGVGDGIMLYFPMGDGQKLLDDVTSSGDNDPRHSDIRWSKYMARLVPMLLQNQSYVKTGIDLAVRYMSQMLLK